MLVSLLVFFFVLGMFMSDNVEAHAAYRRMANAIIITLIINVQTYLYRAFINRFPFCFGFPWLFFWVFSVEASSCCKCRMTNAIIMVATTRIINEAHACMHTFMHAEGGMHSCSMRKMTNAIIIVVTTRIINEAHACMHTFMHAKGGMHSCSKRKVVL